MASSADETPSGGVCLTCGRVGCDLEGHHPAGEANVPEITVPECTPGCHDELTERQRDAGIKLNRDHVRSEAERRWALLSGDASVIGLAAKNRGMPQLAAALEPAAAALGRLLAFSSPAEWQSRTGAAGDVGPDPRRNDLRKALRERQGDSLPNVAEDHSAPGEAAERIRAETLVGLMAQTEGRVFDERTLSGIDLPTLLIRLQQLADRGAFGTFVEWAVRMVPAMGTSVLAVCSADPDNAAETLASTAWVDRLLNAAIVLFVNIASSANADEAQTLLGAFMEAWPAPSLTAS